MLRPDVTLTIILGVSKCPRALKLQPLPQCLNSATDFELYLRSSLGIPSDNIINLFDSGAAAPDQLEQIEDWLAQRISRSAPISPTDLLVYYTGHGGFARNDQSYFLAVQKTRDGSEGATSIRYVDLASSVKRYAGALRKYLILDCCFAAAAILKTQTDISDLIIQRVEDELPPSGTAYLCSSAAKLVSVAPPGERHTMFSGALLQCLREGVPNGPHFLTLEDVGKAARRIIQNKYPNDSVRPEVHVPEQTQGDPAKVPLFPNPQWKDEPPEKQETTVPSAPERAPAHWFTTVLRPRAAKTAVGGLCGFASTVACALIPYPVGVAHLVIEKAQLAPVAPALCLAAGILCILNITSPVKWKATVLLLLATYIAWAIAWMIVWFSMMRLLDLKNPNSVEETLIVSSTIAGFAGSFLLYLMLGTILHGPKWVRLPALHFVLRSSVEFGLWGAIASAIVLVHRIGPLTFTYMLGLFLPWQGWFVSILDVVVYHPNKPATRTEHFSWIIGSLAFIALLTPNAVQNSLNRLTPTPTAAVELSVDSATAKPTKNEQTEITVVSEITKNVSELLSCYAELISGNTVYTADGVSIQVPAEVESTRLTSKFTVLTKAVDGLQIHLICSGLLTYTTPWSNLTVIAAN